jgi:hypothetical protein
MLRKAAQRHVGNGQKVKVKAGPLRVAASRLGHSEDTIAA